MHDSLKIVFDKSKNRAENSSIIRSVRQFRYVVHRKPRNDNNINNDNTSVFATTDPIAYIYIYTQYNLRVIPYIGRHDIIVYYYRISYVCLIKQFFTYSAVSTWCPVRVEGVRICRIAQLPMENKRFMWMYRTRWCRGKSNRHHGGRKNII